MIFSKWKKKKCCEGERCVCRRGIRAQLSSNLHYFLAHSVWALKPLCISTSYSLYPWSLKNETVNTVHWQLWENRFRRILSTHRKIFRSTHPRSAAILVHFSESRSFLFRMFGASNTAPSYSIQPWSCPYETLTYFVSLEITRFCCSFSICGLHAHISSVREIIAEVLDHFTNK